MVRLLARLFAWLDESDVNYRQFMLSLVTGITLGYFLVTVAEQTTLLQDLYILAHEQRRLAMAAAQRAMMANSSHSSENHGGAADGTYDAR